MNREYDLFLPWRQNTPAAVFSQIKDELYFRLNPHWIVEDFSSSAGTYSAMVTDHETAEKFELTGSITVDEDGFPCISAAGESYWQKICFQLKNDSLQVRVSYREEVSEEEERRIVLWLRSMKEYIRLYLTNSLNSRFFRLLMNRVILQMTPSQRKISLMLIRITVLEVLVIFLILVGWYFFFR